MPIQIKLYGELKEKVDQKSEDAGAPIILNIDDKGIETVSDVLKKFFIQEQEISHIFVNGTFSGIRKKVNSGSKVAIFPKRMGLLYKWYFKKVEDD